MSWSKSVSGTPDQIRETIKAWKGEVAASDKIADAHATVAGLHGSQADFGVNTINKFLDTIPESYNASVTAGGHAGVDSEGTVTADSAWLNLGYNKPVAPQS